MRYIIFFYLSWSGLNLALAYDDDQYQGSLDAGLSQWEGPSSFHKLNYDGGRLKKQLIYYPKDIAQGKPRPLVVISHGNGHRYTYYQYLQAYLADKGYVVMSHFNNTSPGIRTAAESTIENTDEFFAKLSSMDNGVLVGHVDPKRIAWIGHSRGGEGVVFAYQQLVQGQVHPKNFGADSIQFISSIAPTTFLSAEAANPGEVNYHMFVGGADGDVNGGPRRVVMSMPIYERGKGEKILTYVQGAGHNVFNDRSHNEGKGPRRLSRTKVHGLSRAVYGSLLDIYLRGEVGLKKYFRSNWARLRPQEVPSDIMISNEFKLAEASGKYWTLDDFQGRPEITEASSGASVTANLISPYEGVLQDGDSTFTFHSADPMNGMTRYINGFDRPRGLVFEWEPQLESSPESKYALTYDLPQPQDMQPFQALSFRVAQITRHPLTDRLNGPMSFSVRLMDKGGELSWLNTKAYGDVNPPYNRRGGWANEFCVFQMPLGDFAAENPALDLSQIVQVEFLFGESFGSAQGRMAIDDIQFVSHSQF